MTKKLTTESAVYEALRGQFSSPAYAVLPGVANGTGGNKRRTVDAMVMSLWPSRGLTLAGVEIKVSRGDLVRELVDPAKQEPIFRFCDHFWLAVGDESIVRDGDVPSTWGLLVPGRGGKLRIAKEAPTLEPEPISRSFLAAILRRAAERFDGDEMRAALRDEARTAVAEEMEALRERAREVSNVERLRARLAVVERFEALAGVHFAEWNQPRVDEAAAIVKAIGGGGTDRLRNSALREAEMVRKTGERMAAIAQSIIDDLDRTAAGEPEMETRDE